MQTCATEDYLKGKTENVKKCTDSQGFFVNNAHAQNSVEQDVFQPGNEASCVATAIARLLLYIPY